MAGWPADLAPRGLRVLVDRGPGELVALAAAIPPPPAPERLAAWLQRTLLWRAPHHAWLWRILCRFRLDWSEERLLFRVETPGVEPFPARGVLDDPSPGERLGALILDTADRRRLRPGSTLVALGRRYFPLSPPLRSGADSRP